MSDPRFEVTTFGEMLLRLSVPTGKRLEKATRLDIYPAGAEANVASLLARLDRQTCWMGALPKNPLGRMAANALRESGVNLDGVLWQEDGRMGTYYVEFGAPPRGIQVTYDRLNSCITVASCKATWCASQLRCELSAKAVDRNGSTANPFAIPSTVRDRILQRKGCEESFSMRWLHAGDRTRDA